MNDFQRILTDPRLDYDIEVQLRLLEVLFSMHPAARGQELETASRRLKIEPQRILQMELLRSKIDRRTAIRSSIQREPLERLTEERIYPTTGWMGEYLTWADHTSAPMCWNFWSAIALINAVCKRNVYCYAGGGPIWLNNYFLLVGPSGSGKSTAINNARAIALAVNRKLKELGRRARPPAELQLMLAADSGTPEAWLTTLSERRSQADFIVTESEDKSETEAEAVEVIRPDCSCFIVKDELVALASSDSFGSARWWNYLLDLYDSPERWVDVKEVRKRELEKVAITALFGCAQDLLADQVSDVIFTGGLMARMITSYRDYGYKSHANSSSADPVVRDRLAEYLAAIGALPPETEVALSPKAQAHYYKLLDHFNQLMRHSHRRIQGWYSRAGHHVAKTAAALALADVRHSVKVIDLEIAWAALEREISGLENLMHYVPSASVGNRIEDVFQMTRQHGPIWFPNLLQKCQRIVGTEWQLRQYIDTLTEQGRLRWTEVVVVGPQVKRLERLLIVNQ